MSEEIKNERIFIRVSPTEKKNLEMKAAQAKMTISKYLITLSENKKITVAENIPELFVEITRIGVNINQIAHVANSQKYVNARQLREVTNLLQAVKEDMEKIIDALYDKEEYTYQNLETRYSSLEERFGSLEETIKSLIERMDNRGSSYSS